MARLVCDLSVVVSVTGCSVVVELDTGTYSVLGTAGVSGVVGEGTTTLVGTDLVVNVTGLTVVDAVELALVLELKVVLGAVEPAVERVSTGNEVTSLG